MTIIDLFVLNLLNSNNIGDSSIVEEIKRNGSTPTIHSSVKVQAILSHHSSGLLVSKPFFSQELYFSDVYIAVYKAR